MAAVGSLSPLLRETGLLHAHMRVAASPHCIAREGDKGDTTWPWQLLHSPPPLDSTRTLIITSPSFTSLGFCQTCPRLL